MNAADKVAQDLFKAAVEKEWSENYMDVMTLEEFQRKKFKDAVDCMFPDPVPYRHVKTNGLYMVLGEGVKEDTLEVMVIYSEALTGKVWLREKKEFYDGRFAKIDVEQEG